jgi:hypothetical protein
MPIYIFENPKTGETKEVLMSMNEIHEYSENGVKWNRVFGNLNISVPYGNIDPWSESAFLRKTKDMKGTMGDMWDLSAELSQKRADQKGKDPIKNTFIEKDKKKKGGKTLLK